MISETECLFTNDRLVVLFFVDDIVVLYQMKHYNNFTTFATKLAERYELCDLGNLKWFLGIRITRDHTEGTVSLSQDSYIKKIATMFNIHEQSRYPKTPMLTEELLPYNGTATPMQIYEYQRKVGLLLYATSMTRLDVACTVSKLAEYLLNPGPKHYEVVLRAIAYLFHTQFLAIQYAATCNPEWMFVCSSDAAYADDTITRWSTEGYLFSLFGGPVDWKSTKQQTVTTSSTEAELLSLTNAAKELYGWKRMFNAIQFNIGHDHEIGCDNLQMLHLLTKEMPILQTKLQHIEIHNHWLRQEVQQGQLRTTWIPMKEMLADGLTKTLARQQHESFVRLLGLVDIKKNIENAQV